MIDKTTNSLTTITLTEKPFNKLMSVFYASVLLPMVNCVITLSKWLWNHEPQARGSSVNFENVMTQFIIGKRTDAQKTDVKLFFTITRPQNGQMTGINKGKDAVNLLLTKISGIPNDATIVNSFSHFLISYLKKSIKSYWLKG